MWFRSSELFWAFLSFYKLSAVLGIGLYISEFFYYSVLM